MNMLASIIGAIGNSRLPKDKQAALTPLVPDRADSPKGAYFKTPPLRKDWRKAVRNNRALLGQIIDLTGSDEGRTLSAAYPDLAKIPVRFDPERGNSYTPQTELEAGDRIIKLCGRDYKVHLNAETLPEVVNLGHRVEDEDEVTLTGLVHEALTHAIAQREGWSEDFLGTSLLAEGSYAKYLMQPGERIAQAHVLYESIPALRDKYTFPELVTALLRDRDSESAEPRTLPFEKPAEEPSDDLPLEEAPLVQENTKKDHSVHAAEGAGETSGGPGGPVPQGAPVPQGGPRIVINPQVFNDRRDALCVAFNEAFRLVMEANGFEPASEPTEAQRKFFSDTAYADDELQLRRTILARIATLDTSVKDPTDEQLEETAEMLEMVMEVGAPQNEWEQAAVKRLHDVVVKALESTRANGSGNPAPAPREGGSVQAAEGAGSTRNTVHRASAPYAGKAPPTEKALAAAVARFAPKRSRLIPEPPDLPERMARAKARRKAAPGGAGAVAAREGGAPAPEPDPADALARQMKDLGFPEGISPRDVALLRRMFPDDVAWTDPGNWGRDPDARSVYYSFPAADGRGTIRRGFTVDAGGQAVPVSEVLDDEGNLLTMKTWEGDDERYIAFNQDGTQFSQRFERDENGEYMPVYEGTLPDAPQDWMDGWEGADEIFAPGFRESLERGEDGLYRPSAEFREWLRSGVPYEDAKGGKTSRRKYGIIRNQGDKP